MRFVTSRRWWRSWVILCVFVCTLLCSASNRDVDLSTLSGPTGFTITASAGGDQSGFAVHAAGDVNKDGVDDFIIGAPRATPVVSTFPRFQAGMSYVIFGRNVANGVAASYTDVDLTSISATGSALGFAIWGAVSYDQSGYSVGKAGDVNNDGIGDVIIGAWHASLPAKASTGIAYVVFGRAYTLGAASYSNVDLLIVENGNTPLGFSIGGAAAGDNTGYSVSGAGDVNYDGVSDVIIGAWTADPLVGGTLRSDGGIAYVIFGRDIINGAAASYASIGLGSIRTTGTSVGFAIWGGAANDACGSSVSNAGDINKDGIADVLVGAYMADAFVSNSYRVNSGIVYVVFGRSAVNAGATGYYTNVDLFPISTQGTGLGFAILGAQAYDDLGSGVSGALDLNGDAIDDILVGAYQGNANVIRDNSGVSYVVFGRASSFANVDLVTFASGGSTLGFAIFGVELNDFSGYSVSTVADMNGDGLSDMIVGAFYADAYLGTNNERQDSGASYVVYGRPLSLGAASYSNIELANFEASSSQGFRILGADDGDRNGWAVSAAGDVNKDGLADVIVGSYASIAKGTDTGASYVIFGALPMPTSQPSAQPSSQPSVQPSRQPSSQPTRQPSSRPSAQPSSRPSGQPSRQPTGAPTKQPSGRPSGQPSRQPSSRPSAQPSSQPSVHPTEQPSGDPSSQPSSQPSVRPSAQSSGQPSSKPSSQPSRRPSGQPSCGPSGQPSSRPSTQPSGQPTAQPSSRPSCQPSSTPSSQPSAQPTCQPSVQPTSLPSSYPSSQPSTVPTTQPSRQPSGQPSMQPFALPSSKPTAGPSVQPSAVPSGQPSTRPSSRPSSQPSAQPTAPPNARPSSHPSAQPAGHPSTQPSGQPSSLPSARPTLQPSVSLTRFSSGIPSAQPSAHPSTQPSSLPSSQPSSVPSVQPTSIPSVQPLSVSSGRPSAQPTCAPTAQPSMQPRATPSSQPTAQPML